MNLIERVQRFSEIGTKISKLTQESKQLRRLIANEINDSEFGVISEEEFTQFLIQNLHVSVKKSGDDFTILLKELEQWTQ